MNSKFPVLRLKNEIEDAYSKIYAPYATITAKENSRKYNENSSNFEIEASFSEIEIESFIRPPLEE